MDTRYIVNHIKNEEQAVHDDDEHCTSPRYINSTYHQSESSYTALNQKCLKRHYDQMMSSSPFCGSNDGTCFLRPLAQHPHHYHPLHHHHHHQPILFRHQPSYNAIPPPLPFDPSSVCPGDIPSHLLLVQEPKFPPQTFDIPDIYDSNSVFGGGGRGPLEPPWAFGDYSSTAQPPSYAGNPFYPSPSLSDRHSPRGGGSVAAVPPPSPQPTTAFPAGAAPWQQQPLTPSRVLSSTGSTDSSPGSHAEESTTAETASSLQQPQQVQPSAKSNGLTSSHSSISRLPNKKARSPKRRKRKDPNEPQKPVSAYSLFFRNAQAAIKSQNPSATFGDVSKIVASMWDGLDDDVKNFYKRQMEMAKKEYLKQLAIYRATLISKDVQEKTGADTEAGISAAQHQAPPPPPPPPPTTPPVQTPSSQKADDGTGSSLSPLCVPSMGFQTQQPLSPTTEPVGHHHHLHHHHHLLHHMMSPSSASHPQPSPLFYQGGSPCLQIGYTSSSDASSSSSAAMRSNFLPYGQKLDHESVMQRIPEPSPYFIGMGLDPEYNKSGEFISLGNGFVNGLCREIPCRSFVESDEADEQKLT